MRLPVPRTLALLPVLAAAVLTGCTQSSSVSEPVPPAPAPPAACLLDTAALAETTGLVWTPDPSTASDTRCVYDPAGGGGFLTVLVAPGDAAQVTEVAQVCAGEPEAAPDGVGFVCTLPSGGVYAAVATGEGLVTLAVSEIPTGTGAAQLSTALGSQLSGIATG